MPTRPDPTPARQSPAAPPLSTRQLTSPHDGHRLPVLHAAAAAASRRGTVLLLQEIFGIDGFIRQQARHWAAAGFDVLAPALFERCAARFEAAHDAQGIERGLACLRDTPDEQALADLQACLAEAATDRPVHVLGFCYGGRLAWRAAARWPGIRSAVVFYGNVWAHQDEVPRCPVMLHFGRLDTHLPVDTMAEQLPQRAPMALLHLYPEAGHGFVADASSPQARAAATTALHRTEGFLQALT